MKWRGRRGSSNVRDLRGQRTSRAGGGGGGLFGLVFMIFRAFGWKGALVAVLIGLAAWGFGIVDPSMLTGGSATNSAVSGPVKSSAEEQERFEFVEVVLAGTEDVWTKELRRVGRDYRLPTLKIYRGRVATACGSGSAQMGPFYCPADEDIYIDLSFYDELAITFNAPGDFAQAYVIAHEVGHHVQNLLGISGKVSARRGQPNYNELSVRLELQADFYAGVWAHHSKEYLEEGDIQEAMRAANAIGDDAIQKRSQGRVVPHAFTHGTSEQRMRWFNKGLQSGAIEDGDTFSMPYAEL